MWLKREGVELLGHCSRCETGIHVDERHYYHEPFIKYGKSRALYCEDCAMTAGWLSIPEDQDASSPVLVGAGDEH